MKEKNSTRVIVGEIATNCWIYPLPYPSDGKTGCAVIDPGAEADRIMANLEKLNLVPHYILLTHGHFDHIAALPNLLTVCRTESNSPQLAIHRLDSGYLGPDSYHEHLACFSASGGKTTQIDYYWNGMPNPDRLLEEGDTIGPFTVLHLPGHTRGSIALWDKEEKILFSGDTLFEGNYGRTDLPGGSEQDIIKSLHRLFALDGDIRVLPGHGPETTIGVEAERKMI